MTYRVGNHYGMHVYEGDRPVATFHDADEARRFVEAMNDGAKDQPRPDWADARVLKIECVLSARLAIRVCGPEVVFRDDQGVLWLLETLAEHAKQASVTVVIDADGNPPGAHSKEDR